MKSDLNENFETALEFLEAFLSEEDEKLEAIEDSTAKNDLLLGLLQVNIVLLKRLEDHEDCPPEELLKNLSATPKRPPLRLL